ncbi:MAG TPA: transposase [Streptosporangiaceae bacterium]|nr:transposase [Streptosporangiaceae bacterium]
MRQVVIGMDPHKRSATTEVMAWDETVLGGGRYATDAAGYQTMLAEVKRWPERIWAIEGCQGIGRHLASRLLAAGEHVVDVPPKLSARTRVFATGQGRKTGATDAHSVALAATRMAGLRPVIDDEQLTVLRVLADRRRSLGEDHTRMICQLHQLLLELIPGGAKKDLSAAQAKALLAKTRPRSAAGKARRRVAAELTSDLERIYQRKKAANRRLPSAPTGGQRRAFCSPARPTTSSVSTPRRRPWPGSLRCTGPTDGLSGRFLAGRRTGPWPARPRAR